MILEEEGRFLAVASNAGSDQPPAWLLNLAAEPLATLRVGPLVLSVRSRVLDPAERTACWDRLLAHNPLYGDFQDRTAREVAVVAFDPLHC